MGGIFGVERALGVFGVQLPNAGWAIWLPVLAFLVSGGKVAHRSLMLNGLLVMLRTITPFAVGCDRVYDPRYTNWRGNQ